MKRIFKKYHGTLNEGKIHKNSREDLFLQKYLSDEKPPFPSQLASLKRPPVNSLPYPRTEQAHSLAHPGLYTHWDEPTPGCSAQGW